MLRSITGPALLCLLLASTALAQADPQVSELKVPFQSTVFIPCTGESVTLSGALHLLNRVTFDAQGGYHLTQHTQPMGVSGLSSSGVEYHATGATILTVNVPGPPPLEQTYVNNFRIIGQGPGNNYLVHETLHITVNANGVVSAEVDNFSVECK